ncbi:DUF4912 domain-containing protein [Brachyspira alvinipulli]|uniref:DUF4912 domain-containing protein n=1 Tax=Brachyspira alvinipulli TaxID=84379 RepID=UPI00047F701A|nr:DUF4912 domain-containing protein [Brachyspira alvinipulli]
MATKKTEKKSEDTPKKKTAATKKTTTTTKKATVKSAATSKKTTTTKKTVSKKKAANENVKDVKEEVKKETYIPDEVDIVRELPDRYNETKLVLMMRDPEWCFFYWDISDNDIAYHSLKNKRISVRIFHVFGYDITNGEIHKEVEVNYIYGDRYVNLAMPHAYFIGELGYYDENNRFIVLARSNMIYAPRDSISNVYDEEWMVNDEIIKLLKSPKALRESLSSATIFELIDLRRHHLAGSSSSLFLKKN